MKYILFSLLILAPCHFFAQSKWKIGAMVSPDLCYRVLKFESANYKSSYESANIDHARLGFSTGLTAIYNFSEKLELESGVLYSRHILFTESTETYYHSPTIDHVTLLTNIDYLIIPVRVNIVLGEDDFGFIGSVGISGAIGFNPNTTRTDYNMSNEAVNEFSYNDNRYPGTTLNAELGAGIHYSLGEKLELRVIPALRYRLRASYNSMHYKFRPMAAGLSCSLIWRI